MKMRMLTFAPLTVGLMLAFNVAAQDHSQHQMPAPATQDHSQHQMPALTVQDHSQHQQPKPKVKPQPKPNPEVTAEQPAAPKPQPAPEAMDHAAMGHDVPQEAPATMDHAAMGHEMPRTADQPVTPIPELTDADRAAAVRPAGGHVMDDNGMQRFVLIDRLEAFDANEGDGVEWDAQAWFGTDLNKLWLRSEGERTGGGTEAADLEVLYGRAFARWWDVVAGVRHDFKPGAPQDFAAIGVMGLAPYKFEVEATAYIGQSGQTAARFEAEYETLLTNRLILQPQVELNFYGRNDERRGIGSGLSTAEAGLRLRYEVTRQFAPYVGVVREWSFGRTADFRRDEGEDINDTRIVAGVRIWF
jgi:copper resistance protein B